MGSATYGPRAIRHIGGLEPSLPAGEHQDDLGPHLILAFHGHAFMELHPHAVKAGLQLDRTPF